MFTNFIITTMHCIILYTTGWYNLCPKKKVGGMLTALVLEWDHKCPLFSSFGLPVFSVHAMITMHHSSKSYFSMERFTHVRNPLTTQQHPEPKQEALFQGACLTSPSVYRLRFPESAETLLRPLRASSQLRAVPPLYSPHVPAQPTASTRFKWHGKQQATAQILSCVTENEPPTF